MSENTQENVGTLDGDAPVERVITQDEVKLYRSKGVVTYLDGGIYDFGAASVTFKANPVPVLNDDNKTIGFASVTVVRDESGRRSLVADIAIDYSTEERLLAETGEKLWPRVFGTMRFAALPLFDFQQRLTPTYLRIDGIQISRVAPSDERIPRFGQVL
jgi:hypothetical protein